MPSVSALGYIGCNVTAADEWREFLHKVFALERRADSLSGLHQYRLDEQHHRLCLHEADSDSLAYIGWEVDAREDVGAFAEHLSAAGIAVTKGDASLCEQRCVLELIAFDGPDGVRTEIFFGLRQDYQPFTPARGMAGYKTGELGLGHVVLASADPDAAVKWYRDLLGFKLSDYIFWDDIEATFLHCNPRHHSLALMNPVGPMQPGDLGHFMFESHSLDDVGRAYDIVQQNNIPLALTLGRHTNDKTTSFYVFTPSGWWMEYGYGGAEIDDATWEPKLYNSPMLWGHEMQLPPGAEDGDPAAQSKR